MSFETICPSCAAISGPSVGICPYCKARIGAGGASTAAAGAATGTSSGGAPDPAGAATATVREQYEKGQLAEALRLAALAESASPRALESAEFTHLYARILIESEAPSSKPRSLLGALLLRNPADAEARELLDLIEARNRFTRELNDEGEKSLRALLKRQPQHDLALFLLGAHLFWIQGETTDSVRLLEQAVRARPTFLRAWGCLGAIYRKLGNGAQAARCFSACLKLETEPAMRAFFEKELRAAAAT